MNDILTTICAGALVLAAAGSAAAEPLGPDELLARTAGGEFRGDTFSLRGFESHIWRFASDGGVSATAVARRAPGNMASMLEFGDVGRWRVQGSLLCVDWAGPNRSFSGCYAVDAQQGSHVRMTGPARWEGSLGR